MKFTALLVSVASLPLIGCGNFGIKEWSQSEKDTMWQGCELMMMGESETTDYCDCVVEKISSSMTTEEFEDVTMKILDLGLDVNKLPDSGNYSTYKQSIRECEG